MDLLRNHHTIYISTFGADTYINFTRKLNSTHPGPVPAPQITNVRIANGTVKGRPGTVAYVTVTNPSNQLYPMKLMVHTTQTQGTLDGAATPAHNNSTLRVELFENPGVKVAGEARLYINKPSDVKGALDEVEFVGRAGGSTDVYNRSYQPVKGPWRNDSYAYQNASVERANHGGVGLGGPTDVPPVAYVGVVVGALAILLFVGFWRR